MWTAAEDSALADAVRRLGLRWSLMAGEAQFASRSPFSLRQRWTRLCASLHTAAPACSSAALGASSISALVVPPPSLELLSGFPPVPRILPLPPPPPRLGRGTSHGRSWTFSLTQRVHAPSAAALTFRRLTLVFATGVWMSVLTLTGCCFATYPLPRRLSGRISRSKACRRRS